MTNDINLFIFCCVIIVFVIHTWWMLDKRLDGHLKSLTTHSDCIKRLLDSDRDQNKFFEYHHERLNALESAVLEMKDRDRQEAHHAPPQG